MPSVNKPKPSPPAEKLPEPLTAQDLFRAMHAAQHPDEMTRKELCGHIDALLGEVKRLHHVLQKDPLVEASSRLIRLYVANLGTSSEFIACITPPGSYSMTAKEREEDRVWRAWDALRHALRERNAGPEIDGRTNRPLPWPKAAKKSPKRKPVRASTRLPTGYTGPRKPA